MYVAITKLTVESFLELAEKHPVLDVRSPGEYQHAHIPGAYSLPLFTDEERKVVGTAYKKESRQQAIKIGLKYFGKKMVKMVEEVEVLVSSEQWLVHSNKTILVHCWRGGMRSAGVAWLLDLYGFKVYTLVGGYKMYRRWVLEQFAKDYPFVVIGGYTGSGKTKLLEALKAKGESVIDFEAIACHKGSAFGNLGMPKQPRQEQFENELAKQLRDTGYVIREDDLGSQPATRNSNPQSPIFIEDESQRIGDINIPTALYATVRKKQVLFIDIPFEERLNFIVQQYGQFDKSDLINAVERIKKRLGGLEAKNALAYLENDDIKNAFAILLTYYDKFYRNGLVRRENPDHQVKKIMFENINWIIHVDQIISINQQ